MEDAHEPSVGASSGQWWQATKVEGAHELPVGASSGPWWQAAKAENACEAAGSRAGVPRLMGRREWRKLA